jgi:DNA polymerase elongation subunit (family B)
VFESRKSAKKKMLSLKKEYEKTHDETKKLESARYGVLQLALKVTLNSLFGTCSNQYFLFFDNRIAEGITMTGQFAIQEVAKTASRTIGGFLKKPDDDFVVYSDTDSMNLVLGDIISKLPGAVDEQKKTDAVIKFIDKHVTPRIKETSDEIAKKLNFYEQTLDFKTEAVSSHTIVLAKKRNMQRVLDNEGVRYSEPDYKVTGIETNRSSTPDLVREWLMDAIKIILDHSDRDLLMQYVYRRRAEFKTYSVEEVAFPRSANNLLTYSDRDKLYKSGCPIAVRAALLYNNLVKTNGLTKDLELIQEGQKIKYIALKEPNTLKENIIGFPAELPKQFNLHRYVDYDTQFEKAFLDPLTKIMDAMNWKLEEENSLCDFFG